MLKDLDIRLKFKNADILTYSELSGTYITIREGLIPNEQVGRTVENGFTQKIKKMWICLFHAI